jgi:hypothetical protein
MGLAKVNIFFFDILTVGNLRRAEENTLRLPFEPLGFEPFGFVGSENFSKTKTAARGERMQEQASFDKLEKTTSLRNNDRNGLVAFRPFLRRVARFSFLQYTKTGKNKQNDQKIYQTAVE